LPEAKVLFTGDLLFKGGVGRTDLPGGNGSQLKESIKRLTQVKIEWLLPGHGEIVSGGTDIKTNFHQIVQSVLNYI
jgi:hydroxyacylglutathione hydrolase